MSGDGPGRLPSPVRSLLSLPDFDSEARKDAFASELRRKVVPRSLSLAALGAASVMVTEMAHPGTIPLLLPLAAVQGANLAVVGVCQLVFAALSHASARWDGGLAACILAVFLTAAICAMSQLYGLCLAALA